MARPTKWIKLFHEFIKPLRIYSKEVSSAEEGGIPLELWDSQLRFLNELAIGLEDGIRFFIECKSRQLGSTTICDVIDVFWPAMFPGTRGALIYDTEQNRDENREIIEGYIGSFPQGYFGNDFGIVKSNRNFTSFTNGSRHTYLVAGTKKKGVSWAEGKGFSYMHATEVSKYGDPDAFSSFIDSLAQKNPNRLFIIESTANGFNHFRSLYYDARDRETLTRRAFFVGWWASNMNRIERNDKRFAQYGLFPLTPDEREKCKIVRERYDHVITPEQLAWIRWREGDPTQDEHMLHQNNPWFDDEAFVQSGYSFFQTRIIGKDLKEVIDGGSEYDYRAYRYELGNDFFAMKLEPVTEKDERHRIELKIWQEPVDGAQYVIGCDPAYGRNDHKDRHNISVWRCFSDKMLQVAEYATNNVEVKHCAWVLAHLAGAYSDCIVNVEIGGPGRMIMMEWDHIRAMLKAEMFAKMVAQRQWDEALDNARWYLYHRPDAMGAGYAANFEANWRTTAELMHQFRGAYVTRELVIRSRFLLEEMANVIQDQSHIGAPESTSEDCKDDRVFGAALAVRAWINWRRPSLIAEGATMQKVLDEESGTMPPATRNLNDLVYRFLKRKDDEANAEPERGPAYLTDRGLA